MAADLFTPILNDLTRSVRFFNGRLLSGEAMADEQRALRAARELLAQAVGDGVVHGLEVAEAIGSSTRTSPVVAVKSGVAINRRGEILVLAGDTEVRLVRPAHQAAGSTRTFQTCTPPEQGVYVADAGVYLLTMCSIGATNGLAEVTGLGGVQASCNAKYVVDAVQFRLLELPVAAATLADTAHLRNRVAYQCFGVDHLLDVARDPFGATGEPHTLLDDIRATTLTDCDVPLAVMYWTATGGIQFLDMWSVRRLLAAPARRDASVLPDPPPSAVGEAMLRQFDEHVHSMPTAGTLSARASDTFRWLPPAGRLPLGGLPGRAGFTASAFFTGLTTRGPLFTEGARLPALLRLASSFPPIRVGDGELVWLYQVRENRQPVDGVSAAQPYLVFALGRVPCQVAPRFDVSHWDYANYALENELTGL